MPRITYHKLIRDRISEVIVAKGDMPKTSILDEPSFLKALKEKLMEEAQELIEAITNKDVLNELSDIEELVRSIAQNHGISMSDLEKHRLQKLKDRGGFEKRLFLEWVDEKQ